MAIRPDYEVGTVSVTAGGVTVTGVGTLWAAADIQTGDTFKVKNLDAIIASVDSNTQITLREAWTGGALAASSYAIRYQPDGSRYTAATRALIELLGNGNLTAFSALAGALDLIPIFTGAGAMTLVSRQELTQGIDVDAKVETLAERAGYDGQAAGFTVLVANVGDGRSAVYFKASNTLGDWSVPAYLTGPNGTFQSKGNYSGAITYAIGDVVLQNGSSWIARVVTTGNPPPTLPTTSNTQWFLLAAAGNGFVFKGDYAGATAYLKDDVVINQGSSWIALQATTGNAPPTLPTTSNAYWKAIAVKGSGDVSGPATNADANLALWNGANSKTLKDGGPITAAGLASVNIAGTPAANKLPYLTGASSSALTDLTAFVRTLLDDADGNAFLTSLGVTKLVSSPGYVKFPNGFVMQGGYDSGGTGDHTITFPVALASVTAVIAHGIGAMAGTSSLAFVATNVTSSSFAIQPRFVNSGGTVGVATQAFYWLVMGFVNP
ncbi:hypothetical protein SAMN04515648_4568 [Phyllobacterium sp. CL33Tsu]|uniref:hypothetical protein n=1 Tax=Phyllobacterium sp. CL33Tsu TaxID=1798191 RepID=UPI0008EE6CA9|nr:hypothetical protein [Phyllobacterium sp. CL33Tsu]SFJ55244.1 hypothetical protein SAMN04515648_4568 [Phyllobacterium sp. CL33Tsu]